MRTKDLRLVLDYILESEYEDYQDYIKDNDLIDNPFNSDINHIYAAATRASLELDVLEENYLMKGN